MHLKASASYNYHRSQNRKPTGQITIFFVRTELFHLIPNGSIDTKIVHKSLLFFLGGKKEVYFLGQSSFVKVSDNQIE